MGLKDKLSEIANSKAIKQMLSSENIEGSFNGIMNKIAKSMGQPTSDEYMEKIQKNYLVVRFKQFSINELANLIINKGSSNNTTNGMYCIFDSDNKLKYQTKDENSFFLDKDTYHLLDSNKNEIGIVKDNLFSVGVPLLEKNAKKCSVYLLDKKLCSIKSYISFGDKEINVTDGNYYINCEKSKKNFIIEHNNKVIAILHTLPYNFNNGYIDKYILEYDDCEFELVNVLLSIAIDTVF